MRRAALVVLGLVVAFGAGAGFVARQDRGAGVEVMRPAAGPGERTRSLRAVSPSRIEPVADRRSERRDGRTFGGWRAVQLGLDALNAMIGLVGIAMAWRGMRGRTAPVRTSQRAASHTPDRMSPSPTA